MRNGKESLEDVDESQYASIVLQVMDELHLDDISCTQQELREMVRKSDIMILPGLTLKELFILDQVRKKKIQPLYHILSPLTRLRGYGMILKKKLLQIGLPSK